MIETLRRGRWQISVSLGVVLSFLIATTVAWMRANTIDADVDDIVGNAMPSVELLSAARTDLHRVEDAFDRYAESRSERERAVIRTDRMNLDAAVASYRALPYFPGEPVLAEDALHALVRLDRSLEHAIEGIERGGPLSKVSFDEVHEAVDRVDVALSRIIRFDATQGQRLGLSVAHARRSSTYTAVALDAFAIGLAVFATALAVRSVRQDMRALEQARDSATARATMSEERNAELEQFSGRVAHDILSPLMAVGLALELSKARFADDPKALETFDRGLRSLARVRRIVDGLLEFARAGAKPREGVSADLAEVVADVVEGARADAGDVEIVVSPFPPAFVSCSSGALTSIVANLVRNAVKHMGSASTRLITIRVTLPGDVVRVEVEDTGPGIPPELEDRIFEPFVRGHGNVAGIGLGLATVKRLVVAHGGRVGCRSSDGAGSTFWFELPRSHPAQVLALSA